MSEQIGIIGLAVMGENLVLNLTDHGASVGVYNRTAERTRKFIEGPAAGRPVRAASSVAELVGRLERPRRVLLMVKAGPPVDAVLDELVPHLEPGDIIIDGGNSHFRDTERRAERLAQKGLLYVGMGVSGGEEGARHGPSLMPGGPRPAYEQLEPLLKKIAAQTDSGPCVTFVGTGGAGHFVKIVHNGIEYGDMQLIAEAYDLLRRGAGLSSAQLAEVFDTWNQGELRSYLIETTARVVAFPDDQGTGDMLIDRIDDRAGQKGTGKWTTQAALDLGVPVPTITAAVDARLLSALKIERQKAAEVYPSRAGTNSNGAADRGISVDPAGLSVAAKEVIDEVRQGLYVAKVCSYAQGFALLAAGSREYGYGLDLSEIARIWKGGCIIRAALLDPIHAAFRGDPGLSNLLLDTGFAREIAGRLGAWRRVVGRAQQWGIPVPAFSASLAYFDSYRSARLPANLVQAQRDYFGAHTYERIDRPGIFHTDWTKTVRK
ncbi:MAG: NADP-dependent phosphogluconate dehydrogenase [Planctomycetes bacterium]|nr:NADP-dependent phosphogluconate dehydrogenase [Planctomycetota bacterium]